MAHITGLAHAALRVTDLDEGVAFYVEGLGLTLRHKAEHAAVIAAEDDTLIEIFDAGEPCREATGWTHICLNTVDCDAAVSRAVSYGATVTKEPYMLGNLRIAFVTAPTGEDVEFWYIGGYGLTREPVIGNRYVKSVIHAAMNVPDMAASVKFYEALGMKKKSDWGWGCSMQLEDGREMELFDHAAPAQDNGGIVHVAFYCDDVDGTLAAALAAGGRLQTPPKDSMNVRLAFFIGPAGEQVELFKLNPDMAPTFFSPKAHEETEYHF